MQHNLQLEDLGMPDLRTRRTQAMILQAFTELLTQEPFSKITVNEIADASLINRSTFYKHFVDKFALLEYHFNQVIVNDHIETHDIYRHPFKMLAEIKSSSLRPLIQTQADDEQFVKEFSNFFFERIISQHKEIFPLNQCFFIGRVNAITRWIRVTHQQFDIFSDYDELDRIFNNV